jgi:hypothetical protein
MDVLKLAQAESSIGFTNSCQRVLGFILKDIWINPQHVIRGYFCIDESRDKIMYWTHLP